MEKEAKNQKKSTGQEWRYKKTEPVKKTLEAQEKALSEKKQAEKQAKEASKEKIDPMTLWLRRYGVVDKDAEEEKVYVTIPKTTASDKTRMQNALKTAGLTCTFLEEYNDAVMHGNRFVLYDDNGDIIKDGDELAAVSLVKDEQLIITTANGMAIRFDSKEVSPTSRATSGVKGINLADGDMVVSAIPVRNTNDKLAIFVNGGYCKKFGLDELPVQKRAGKGLMCYKPTDSTGKVVAATLVEDGDNVLVIGDKSSICIDASDIPVLGRASIGNQVIKNNKILSVSKV